ncbi:unnamed protein product [Dovyalis caffra]|uniref:Uncharacterized protein n=1 Tax=Dovyalis caffra TaxID=77055 RepID=A0AAV1SHX0_9ROSI|nr:unnamed protein product [Dovyalis caffra]
MVKFDDAPRLRAGPWWAEVRGPTPKYKDKGRRLTGVRGHTNSTHRRLTDGVNFLLEPPNQRISSFDRTEGAATMVKYFREPNNPTKCNLQGKGSDLRVHFKNTRETAFALRKLPLIKAKRYLEDVLLTNRPFLSDASVVEWGVLLKQRTDTRMDNDAGLSSLYTKLRPET